MKALDPAKAAEIYVRHYFREPKLDLLAGAAAAQRLRHAGQRRRQRRAYPAAADGRLRPAAEGRRGHRPGYRRTVAEAMRRAPDHLVDAYGIARRNYYYRLADQRPASRKYARARDGGKGGWITRAEEFISERFRLSLAEHDARVAAWA